jgi:hypothetical protein
MKKLLFIVIAVLGLSFVSTTHAVSISLSIPVQGTNPCPYPTATTCSAGGFINSFYQFALAFAGIVAFGSVVYGGVKYVTAAGNPSGQSEAKEWIYSALLGLALLFGAYLILNTINPNLTHLDLPTIQSH